MSNVSIAESRLLFLRLSVSASFTNLESLKLIDFDGITSQISSNFTSMVNQQRTLQDMGAAVKSPEQLQSEVNQLISQLNDYKKHSDEIVKLNEIKIKEWGNSLYLTTPIQQASELIFTSSQSEESQLYWKKTLPEVYNKASSIEIQMTSLFNDDLYTSVNKIPRKDIVNREFNDLAKLIEPLENEDARNILASAFKSQSDMNIVLWNATGDITKNKKALSTYKEVFGNLISIIPYNINNLSIENFPVST